MIDPVLDAALNYAAAGFPVVPIRLTKAGKKFPPIKGWQKLATTDPDTIRSWWTKDYKGCGVAVLTGTRSCLYSVDVDIKTVDGMKVFKALGLTGLDRTPTVVTQSNGNHFHFRTPAGLILKNTQSVIGPGIDTRGEGGCIVMPPSRLDPKRPPYEWVNGVRLSDAPPLPAEILSLVTKPQGKAHQALAAAVESLRTSRPAQRHTIILQATMEMAKLVTADKLGYSEVLDALSNAAREVGHDRLEVEQAFEGALVKIRPKTGGKYGRTAKPATPPPDIEALESSAADIIACVNVLAMFATAVSSLIAGEAANVKLLYLAATSRLFNRPMHACVKGPSAGGKSELRKAVLAFFPTEDVIAFTTLSDRALLYFEEDFAHKIMSMGEAAGADEQHMQDYLLRELMSEGVLRYPVAQKIGGEIVTTVIEKHGPVCFLVTTTRANLHAENETRMLGLETDDSQDQTRAVLVKIAETIGEQGIGTIADIVNIAPWHDFQRWLAAGNRNIVIPYASVLAEQTAVPSVRLRRDFGQLLSAIKAHALIHRTHREVDTAGRIVADIAHDYAAVRALMADILAIASETKIRPETEATIEAVRFLQPKSPEKDLSGNIRTDQGANVADIAKQLRIDRSAAHRRLGTTEAAGLVFNLEKNPRKGRPNYYRTTDAIADTTPILPDPKALEEAFFASIGGER